VPHLRFRRHGMAGFMASCPASLSVDRTYVAIEPRIVGVFEIWREEIRNRNRLLDFGGKKFEIEIDSSILAGRNSNKNWREGRLG
jgi:hypothetical protein